jgi:hypothetical protein
MDLRNGFCLRYDAGASRADRPPFSQHFPNLGNWTGWPGRVFSDDA